MSINERLFLEIRPNTDGGLRHDWIQLWNLSSEVFSLLAKTGIPEEKLVSLALMVFARAMANGSTVPPEIAWYNVLAIPSFKAGFTAAFELQQDFAERLKEARALLEEEEPPGVKH